MTLAVPLVREAAPMTPPTPAISGQGSLLIDEAAAALGVSRRTVYYRIRQGRLATIRTRGGSQRVLWSSIRGAVAAGETSAAPAASADVHAAR
jgi:excisionase family DNA binding protein